MNNYLTTEEASKLVIPERSSQTIRRWITYRGLRASKGLRLMIYRKDFEEFCNENCIAMKEE